MNTEMLKILYVYEFVEMLPKIFDPPKRKLHNWPYSKRDAANACFWSAANGKTTRTFLLLVRKRIPKNPFPKSLKSLWHAKDCLLTCPSLAWLAQAILLKLKVKSLEIRYLPTWSLEKGFWWKSCVKTSMFWVWKKKSKKHRHFL